MRIDSDHNKRCHARIVALSWGSSSFRAALLADPAKVAREHGMELPEGTQVTVVDDGPGFVVRDGAAGRGVDIALPPPPADLFDTPIMTRTSAAYMCAPASLFGDAPSLEIAVPPPPEDLLDTPIMSRTSCAYHGCAPTQLLAA